jgi:hypothetical protein
LRVWTHKNNNNNEQQQLARTRTNTRSKLCTACAPAERLKSRKHLSPIAND